MPINSIDNDDNVTIQDGDGSGLKANVVTRSDSKKAVCVDALVKQNVGSFPLFDPSTLIYEEATGIARDTVLTTSFQTVYSYSGSGSFVGMNLNFDNDSEIDVRLTIDSNDILFGSSGVYLKDIKDNGIYDVKDVSNEMNVLGLALHDSCFRFQLPYPVSFSSNVTVQIKTRTNKKYKAGFVLINKVS